MSNIGTTAPAMREYGNRKKLVETPVKNLVKEPASIPNPAASAAEVDVAVNSDGTGRVLGKRHDGISDHADTSAEKKMKFTTIGSSFSGRDVVKGSLPHTFREATDLVRFVAGRKNSALQKERDDIVKAAADSAKRVQELEKKLKGKDDAIRSLRKSGPLWTKYPSVLVTRMMKTSDYEKVFLEFTDITRKLGQSEGLKMYLTQFPELGKHVLPSMEDLDYAIAEDRAALRQAFIDSVRDDEFKFSFLDHIKEMSHLPDIKGLKSLSTDYNSGLPDEMKHLPPRKSAENKTDNAAGVVNASANDAEETVIIEANVS